MDNSKKKVKEHQKEHRKKYLKKYNQKPEVKEQRKKYRQRPEVKEREKKYGKKYRQRPEVKEHRKKYSQKPEVKEQQKKYRQRPEIKKRQKKYSQKPEVKEQQKKYRQRPEVKEHRKKYSQRSEVKEREKKNRQRPDALEKRAKKSLQIRIDVLTHYSNGTMKCEKCEENEFEFLELNHIKRRKDFDRPNDLSGMSLYKKLKIDGYPEGFNVLCGNCNWLDFIEKAKKGKYGGEIMSKFNKEDGKLKMKVYSYYSRGKPKCNCCGIDNIDVLSLDHIISLKREPMQLSHRVKGQGKYKEIIKNNFPQIYQILCRKCNSSKGEKSDCYHLRKILLEQHNQRIEEEKQSQLKKLKNN